MKYPVYLLAFFILFAACRNERKDEEIIMTVTGPMVPEGLRRTLTHEHVVTDFTGAGKVPRPQYEQEEAVALILPHLQALKKKGVDLLVECTPNHIGRDVRLLRRLSELSGVRIVSNTGYYAAADKKFLPAHVYREPLERIAARWEKEWTEGIAGTGIRPGFLKLGVDKGPLDSLEIKLLSAAALVSERSGLPIAVHSGDGLAAIQELELLKDLGTPPEKLIWVHAQNGTDEERRTLGEAGAWISLDGVNRKSLSQYTQMIVRMKENDLLSRLLLSHDDGWSVENDGGQISLVPFNNGNRRPYVTIFESLIDSLLRHGLSEKEVERVLVSNPKKAFVIKR